MSVTPKRHWFQFGLRGLFAGLAIMACALAWLIYAMNWIHDRNEIANRGNVVAANAYGPVHSIRQPRAPGTLWLLGEAGKARIVFYFPDSQRQGLAVNRDAETLLKPDERAELARAMILFPESDVACSFAPAPLK